MSAPAYLFVYGTLRRGSDNDMYRLLAAQAHLLAPGWFNGQLYRVNWYPCAIPSTLPQERVYGEVYVLSDPDTLLPQLDDYEECSERYPEPREYRREQRPVTLAGGEVIAAWIYLYNREVAGLQRIASGDFFEQPATA